MNVVLENKADSNLYTGEYYARNLLASAKDGLLKSCAPLTALISTIGTIRHLIPEYFCDDPDLDDPEEDFIVDNEDQIRDFVELYVKHGIKIDERRDAAVIEKVRSIVRESLFESLCKYKEVVDELNEKFQLSTKLCVNIWDPYFEYTEFQTYGGTKSWTNPVIECQLLPMKMTPQEDTNKVKQAGEPKQPTPADNDLIDPKIKFVFTHEFMHILHNDTLAASAWKHTATLLSCIPWITDYSTSTSWASYIFSAAAKSFLIEATSDFFYTMFARSFERRADIEALNYMKTNKGALAFFSRCGEAPNDFLHPPLSERVRYAKDWKEA